MQQQGTGEKKKRYIILILCLVLIFVIYELQLFNWQIVNGEKYAKDAANQSTDNIKMEATRGEILDKNGNVLTGNTITYCVQFNAMKMDNTNRNPALMQVLDILNERGEAWTDNLPILINEEGEYIFDETRESEIEYLKSSAMLDLQDYATAEDCMNALIRRFNCAGYSNVVTRNLVSIRYSMAKQGFSQTKPHVIAPDVSPETVGVFNQLESEIPGVETAVNVSRNYGDDPTTAPHIIGTIGALSPEQYEQLEEEGNLYSLDNLGGYSYDDTIGKSGIESAFEEELRGTNGVAKIETDAAGKLTGKTVLQSPVPGNTVQLTLDSELQRVANAALQENVENNTKFPDSKGGAVAIDIKTGGVLASANYPSFDLEKYYNDNEYYNMLVEDDENYPLVNRAMEGVYTPGSVFKPLVAIGALQEEEISTTTTEYCEGHLDFYGQTYNCLGTHGNVDVYGALQDSCNVFFYHAGRKLTIRRMEVYANLFGLGVKTGVEISESSGRMSSREYYEEHNVDSWQDGHTISAAIGQQDDQFTPLQLATYTAAIANNGVRYQTHLLDKVLDYTGEKVLYEHETTVMETADVDAWVMQEVQYGMRLVSTQGTAADVFADYPVSVCSKTGTAENSGKQADNLTFIAYAPADDPQIAVAVVLEHAGKGEYARNVAKAMFDQYFGYDEDGEPIESPSPSPVPTEPVGGPDANIGAFYDPEKDAPSKIVEESSSLEDSSWVESGDDE